MNTRYHTSLRVFGSAFIAICVGAGTAASQEPPLSLGELLDLPLEELRQIPVTSATLTDTSRRKTPASVTTISHEMIVRSGARNLFDLFDIYLPNFQWTRHHWESSHMGLRGIISDRDDKYLFLVNGIAINERTHFGAIAEKDLAMLDDIHHIEIIRGPGSAIQGAGAVSMVVNLVTYNGKTFEESEATLRAGAIEEFESGEFKHALRLGDEYRLFVYGGVSNYVGASQSHSPLVLGYESAVTGTGEPGEPYPGTIDRDRAQARDLPPLKFHAQLTGNDSDLWIRYSRGGEQYTPAQGYLAEQPYGWLPDAVANSSQWRSGQTAYQQLNLQGSHRFNWTETLDTTLDAGFSATDFKRWLPDSTFFSDREDQYRARAISRWTPVEQHSLALVLEYTHQEFGLDSSGGPDVPPSTALLVDMPRWAVDLYSIAAEHQWSPAEQWTIFSGARADKHPFTHWLFSPRLGAVYMPSDEDTVKLVFSRSLRRNFDEEMKYTADRSNTSLDPEDANTAELRYERDHTNGLTSAASLFYNELHLIGYSQATSRNQTAGDYKSIGFEVETSLDRAGYHLKASHGFTKLLHYSLEDGMAGSLVSAAPYGFGNDLNNWSNHVSRLWSAYDFSEAWSIDSSLIVYWGFSGSEDYLNYQNSLGTLTIPGYDKAFNPACYLNLGISHDIAKDLRVRIDGYNLLGIVDRDLNKRGYFTEMEGYRSHAPAVGVSLRYRF